MIAEGAFPGEDNDHPTGGLMADKGALEAWAKPRIVVEHSDYWLTNKGDLAMLDVTLARIHERWPHARVGVLTETPLLLRAYFPRAEPIAPWGSRVWSSASPVARVCRWAGASMVGPVAHRWVSTQVRSRRAARTLRGRAKDWSASRTGDRQAIAITGIADMLAVTAQAPDDGVPTNTRAAVDSASLVLALGGGYLTDADLPQSNRVLDLLGYAQRRGVPTAMIGQGLGPIQEPQLVRKLALIAPHVRFISLREGRRGPDLLAQAGVSPEVVQVTGDDAIELAHALSTDRIGSDIGICLRVADYSPVASEAHRAVKAAIQAVANDVRAGLAPIFISEYASQDRRSTLPLVEGFEKVGQPLGRFATSRDVAAQIGRCRVLVTGAYHAAVFALAQGIPVVALTTTRYYDDKFLGLVQMFGGGLDLVRLDPEGLQGRLSAAIASAWVQAPDVRLSLQAGAEGQIRSSRRALDRVLGLVDVASPERS